MALIRSVPRSATVKAEGEAELIAIRRADFFDILRKEHELAVKMLWQFLGVLADRLDQTSSELRHAKQELSAEDISAEIFPDMGDTSERGVIDDSFITGSGTGSGTEEDAKLDPAAQSAIVDLKSLNLDLGGGKDGSS
jgi:CRP-like cAMP-binding protein